MGNPAFTTEKFSPEQGKAAQAASSGAGGAGGGFVFDGDAPIAAPPMLIKQILPRDGLTFLGGQSQAGKTFVAIRMAHSLATGQHFFGRAVRERVGVAIFAGEGAATIPNRIAAVRLGLGGNDAAPLPIAWLGEVPNLAEPKEVQAMIPRLKAVADKMRSRYGVRLGAVIFDTLAATFDLDDENDNSAAAKVIRSIRAIGSATDAVTTPVHHFGRTAENGLRGASGWRAGADVILAVTATRVGDSVKGRALSLAKSREGVEGPLSDFALEFVPLGIDEDRETFGACVAVPVQAEAKAASDDAGAKAEKPAKRAKLKPAEAIALRALDRAVADHGEAPPVAGHIPADAKVVTVELWRAMTIQMKVSTGETSRAKNKAFKIAADRLTDDGLVKVWGDWVWRPT